MYDQMERAVGGKSRMPIFSESLWPLCVALSIPPGSRKKQELDQRYRDCGRNRGSLLNNRKAFPRMVMGHRTGTGLTPKSHCLLGWVLGGQHLDLLRLFR